MASIGEKLRQERLRQNLGLAQVADQTKIGRKFLEAIEAEQWDRLPGKFFIKSFVRLYASALGVDAGEVEAALDRLLETEKPASGTEPEHTGRLTQLPLARSWRPRSSFSQRGRLALLAALACAVLLSGGIFALRRNVSQRPAPLAERPAATAAVGSESTLPRQPEPPVEGGIPPSSVDQPPPPQQPASLRPAGGLLLSLAATEASWISLTVDGRTVFSGILNPGGKRSFQGTERMTLRAGNAGGLEVHWNGQPIGPIGQPGEVCVVGFTPEGFQIRRGGLGAPAPSTPIP
jgi:transcriptional regulator with XRE-family HTH domain